MPQSVLLMLPQVLLVTFVYCRWRQSPFKMQKSPGDEGAEQKEIGWWAAFRVHLYFLLINHLLPKVQMSWGKFPRGRKEKDKRRSHCQAVLPGKGIVSPEDHLVSRECSPNPGRRRALCRQGGSLHKETASCLFHSALLNDLHIPLAYLYFFEIRNF